MDQVEFRAKASVALENQDVLSAREVLDVWWQDGQEARVHKVTEWHDLDFGKLGMNLTAGEYELLRDIAAGFAQQVDLDSACRLQKQSAIREYDFSVLIPVHNSEPYLLSLFRCLESQDAARVEFLFFDDNSSDASAELVTNWCGDRDNVTLVRSFAHFGVARAKNVLLGYARGKWVTTVDSDDMIAPDYFASMKRFIDSHPECVMYTSRILRMNGESGVVGDILPLGFKFQNGSSVADLSVQSANVQLSATAFLSLERIRKASLRFDARVRPTFEDGKFISEYLLTTSGSGLFVGQNAEAKYFYRSHVCGQSLVSSGWNVVERYDDQLVFGYLDLLKRFASPSEVPAWLANTIAYDISWYFTEDLQTRARTMPLLVNTNLRLKFLNNLQEVFRHLPNNFVIPRPVSGALRSAIGQRFYGEPPAGAYKQYFFGELFGLVEYEEEPQPYRGANPVSIWERGRIKRTVTGAGALALAKDTVEARGRSLVLRSRTQAEMALIKLFPNRAYRDCWLLIDRAQGAGDNAEHLYRWLLENSTENVYFVLNRDAPGWRRLKSTGRLIPYGSFEAHRAFSEAKVVISSDAVVQSRELAPRYLWGQAQARFVFLQHGVIFNRNIKNISGWLNPINIDLFVTSLEAERDYVLSGESRFRIEGERVILTGLARWDRLKTLSAEVVRDDNKIVLMPTWFPGGNYSDWLNLASELGEKYEVIFVVHPSISLKELGVQGKFDFFDPRADDFQSLVASCHAFITDYSSTLFDAALSGARVGFFYPDGREVLPAYPEAKLEPAFSNSKDLKDWLFGDEPGYEIRVTTFDGHARERIYSEIWDMLHHK